MATIVLEGLRKVYPGKPPVVALEGLDLTIEDGELAVRLRQEHGAAVRGRVGEAVVRTRAHRWA
jgi:hypothetical protein